MSDTGFDLNSLTPEELQTLQLLMMQQGQLAPGAFGSGDYGLSTDQAGMDLTGYNNANYPTLTPKGKVDPLDLPQIAQRLNLTQDIFGSYKDPTLGALAGPGAFGPDAFTPKYDFGTPLNMTGQKQAQHYINTGGYRGFIADAILNQHMGPDEAVAAAIELANNTDTTNLDPKRKALIISLQKTLPLAGPDKTDPVTGEPLAKASGPGGRTASAYDETKILGDATKMFDAIASDPTFVYQDPTTGNFYDKTPEQAMIKTPTMEAFDKMGIPYLNQQYSDPGYVDRAIQADTGRSADEQTQASDDYQQRMTQMLREQQDRFDQIGTQSQQLDQLNKALGPEQPGPTDVMRQRPPAMAATLNPQSIESLMRLHPQRPTVQVPPTAYAQGFADLNYQRETPPPAGPQSWVNQLDPQGPLGKLTALGGHPPPQLQPMPEMKAPVYVDKDGNIVTPQDLPGGVRSLADTAKSRGLTKREATRGDAKQLQSQIAQQQQAVNDWYKKRSDMMANDPNLDRIYAVARAQALGQAGRTPARDALMQRAMALRSMGPFGG